MLKYPASPLFGLRRRIGLSRHFSTRDTSVCGINPGPAGTTAAYQNETRYEVPAGKWGSVQAYPLCDLYQGNVYDLFGPDTGKDAYGYKPVGVCFNSWNK
ncbi:hypothetical protein [Streptomyces sp. NPDC056401]|uniref:hypothetical protein n=1 Tax=Streptomyces sp. NPDC056401 TaxID=3345809 RepID=UPI0035D612E4